jgi:hypothetical protein
MLDRDSGGREMNDGADRPMKVKGQLIQIRHECFLLRAENAQLAPAKGELAQLRMSVADFIFTNSEKVIDLTSALQLS